MFFLIGWWVVKEVYSKVFGIGIGKVNFYDIEILLDDKGVFLIIKELFNGKFFVLIFYSGNYV